MRPTSLALATLLTACAPERELEDVASWFDDGTAEPVVEPLAFTDEPYGLPAGDNPGMAELLAPALEFPRGFGTRVGSSETGGAACGWTIDDALPVEITGVVTVLPRYYFKSNGCTNDDEKFYGSYFIEDDTGGMFVLGDTKVAWFDAGDTVTLRVRGTRVSFDQPMIYIHDVVSVDRTARPVRYEVSEGGLGEADLNQVRRITGTVVTEPDTFGEFSLLPDGSDGPCEEAGDRGCAVASIDSELNRRGVTFTPGERVTVTGPVLYSYSVYKIILMRLGQIERHTD